MNTSTKGYTQRKTRTSLAVVDAAVAAASAVSAAASAASRSGSTEFTSVARRAAAGPVNRKRRQSMNNSMNNRIARAGMNKKKRT